MLSGIFWKGLNIKTICMLIQGKRKKYVVNEAAYICFKWLEPQVRQLISCHGTCLLLRGYFLLKLRKHLLPKQCFKESCSIQCNMVYCFSTHKLISIQKTTRYAINKNTKYKLQHNFWLKLSKLVSTTYFFLCLSQTHFCITLQRQQSSLSGL